MNQKQQDGVKEKVSAGNSSQPDNGSNSEQPKRGRGRPRKDRGNAKAEEDDGDGYPDAGSARRNDDGPFSDCWE